MGWKIVSLNLLYLELISLQVMCIHKYRVCFQSDRFIFALIFAMQFWMQLMCRETCSLWISFSVVVFPLFAIILNCLLMSWTDCPKGLFLMLCILPLMPWHLPDNTLEFHFVIWPTDRIHSQQVIKWKDIHIKAEQQLFLTNALLNFNIYSPHEVWSRHALTKKLMAAVNVVITMWHFRICFASNVTETQ